MFISVVMYNLLILIIECAMYTFLLSSVAVLVCVARGVLRLVDVYDTVVSCECVCVDIYLHISCIPCVLLVQICP